MNLPTDLRPTGSGALYLSIVGRNNTPLWSALAEGAQRNAYNIQMFGYSSLDIVDEKCIKATENYLGQIYSDYFFKTFAYVSSTGVKFVFVTDTKSQGLTDPEVRLLFKRLHTAYCQAISNPFHQAKAPIKSKFLTEVADQIFAQ
ncbi:unnamed protein product, partial [Mesorhabditis spiculigera]